MDKRLNNPETPEYEKSNEANMQGCLERPVQKLFIVRRLRGRVHDVALHFMIFENKKASICTTIYHIIKLLYVKRLFY